MSTDYGLRPPGATSRVNWTQTFQGFDLYYKALWLTILLGVGVTAMMMAMYPDGDPDLLLGGVLVFNAANMAVSVMLIVALVRFATLANHVKAAPLVKTSIGLSVALVAVHLLTFFRQLIDGFGAMDPEFAGGLLDTLVSAASVVNYVCQLLFLKRVVALVKAEDLNATIMSLLAIAALVFIMGVVPGLSTNALKGVLILVGFVMFMALIHKLRKEVRRFSDLDVGAF